MFAFVCIKDYICFRNAKSPLFCIYSDSPSSIYSKISEALQFRIKHMVSSVLVLMGAPCFILCRIFAEKPCLKMRNSAGESVCPIKNKLLLCYTQKCR